MVRTQRGAAVVAECLRRAGTGCAKLILHPSNLNNSANEVVHEQENISLRRTCGILEGMRHTDVDTDVINCNGKLKQLAEETDNDGQRLLFLRCSRCGMEFLFCLDSSKMVMTMPGPIY
jgi:hypothetical protein